AINGATVSTRVKARREVGVDALVGRRDVRLEVVEEGREPAGISLGCRGHAEEVLNFVDLGPETLGGSAEGRRPERGDLPVGLTPSFGLSGQAPERERRAGLAINLEADLASRRRRHDTRHGSFARSDRVEPRRDLSEWLGPSGEAQRED